MSILGIDVSHYQGTIDWQQVAATGVVKFALIKATEGTGYIDPSFADNVRGARAHGIIPGAYHFLHGGNVSGQWSFFTRVVGDPSGMLTVCDEEASDVTTSDVAAWDTVRKAWKMPHGYYSNRGLWHGGSVAASDTWPWHAGNANGRYTSATGSLQNQLAHTILSPSSFGGFNSFKMIQFTDHAIVPGIIGPCDGNVWLGTFAELSALASGGIMGVLGNDDITAVAKAVVYYTYHSVEGDKSLGTFAAQGGVYAHQNNDILTAMADDVAALKTQTADIETAVKAGLTANVSLTDAQITELASAVTSGVEAALQGKTGLTVDEVTAAVEAGVRTVLHGA